MRTKLTTTESIPKVIKDMTLDEKLDMVGAYRACHTLEIADMDIPSIYLMDGATGVNGVQVILDYITDPDRQPGGQLAASNAYATPEMVELNHVSLEDAAEKYKQDELMAGLVRHVARFRPKGKAFISFPSGANIGASFDPDQAYKIGQAVGWEMRNSGIDVCLGPNVDIARDPLGGRNYEMYGEDPELVARIAEQFIRGVQSTGTAACAKHFIANNQETGRNTKDTHLSQRTMREIYGRGFWAAVKNGGVKTIMSAYNAINGTFTSYSKPLLTGWLRGEWDFQGMVVSDWGAATHNKEGSLDAGMDLILCGPNDMTECKKAVQEGRLREAVLDERVANILRVIVALRDEQAGIPAQYDAPALLQCACDTVVEGSVLLKNEGGLLPLPADARVAFFGSCSKNMLEFGSGSTAVHTSLHSNVYDEFARLRGEPLFETMDGADTLVYTATAPAGENVDRNEMDIEETDRARMPRVLRETKEMGLKTVVILNVAGPVDMREWVDYADSILCVFLPGCMGGTAAARMLTGDATPAGKLPVTFPMRVEDTPSYPNFPGEHGDVYYGEGVFVGYRSYDKRDIPVMYPFGHGLSYTSFEAELLANSFEFDYRTGDAIEIPVRVKNTGNRVGSEVVQIYTAEEAPRILRPVKELVGFAKVRLEPGEEKVVRVVLRKDGLSYFDDRLKQWVSPIGAHRLYVGTSSKDIFGQATLTVLGANPYPLSGESTIGEIIKNPKAVELVNRYAGNMFELAGEEAINFMIDRKLSDILAIGMVQAIPDAVKLDAILQDLYARLAEL